MIRCLGNSCLILSFFFNLNSSWTTLIMSCVTTVSTSILWNGEALDEFSPGRGLKQGDPLSPYLFVLCMDRLSILINQKAEEGKWKGIKAFRNTNPLTHLFFADVLILFGQDNISNCNVMMGVINEFCCMSGQFISLAKSKLFVSLNVSRNKAKRLSGASGILLTNDLGKYLGIPFLHKRVTKDHFNHILEKIQKRLSCWKSNTLMLAGRATLIQSSASPIPSYTMQTMKIPASVCDKIDCLHRNFLWGDTPNKKRIHFVN